MKKYRIRNGSPLDVGLLIVTLAVGYSVLFHEISVMYH